MSTPVVPETGTVTDLATREKWVAAIPNHPLTDNIIDALVQGDLTKLEPKDRARYYNALCERVGIDPAFIPFSYLILNGKLVLYANKSCAEQLRKVHGISVKITARQNVGDVYVVIATALASNGREDESIGAVAVGKLSGDSLANALMKAETKAKRRVTLSICGLGMLDETELETVPKNTMRNVTFNDKGDVVPVPLPELPKKAPSGAEVSAKYAELRKARPELNLPPTIKDWAPSVLPNYNRNRNATEQEIVEINRIICELYQGPAVISEAPQPSANAPESAQDAEFTPVAAETPPAPAQAPQGPPAHAKTAITAKTRGQCMAAVAALGWKEKTDRLAYAEQNGLPVTSYNELSEAQGQWLIAQARADLKASSPCGACNAKPGDAHADGCPEDLK